MKNWKVNSWRKYPVKHIPSYDDEKALNMVLNKLRSSPPLVFAGETRHLKDQLSEVVDGKAFLGQMLVLYLLCLKMGKLNDDIKKKDYISKIKCLLNLSKNIELSLKSENNIQTISNSFTNIKGSMFLGRGYSYPIALEGALKLKELSYIHAEGYPAG